MATLVRRRNSNGLFPALFSNDPLFDTFLEQLAPQVRGWASEDNTGVNVYEENNKLIAEFIVPGFSKKDIELSIHDDQLSVEAKANDESNHEGKRLYYHRGLSIKTFRRTLQLPYTVNADKVKAQYDKGILYIEMEKMAESRGRLITID